LELITHTFKLQEFIKLARPHQYLKNLFIFLPLFFSLEITNLSLFLNTLEAFIAFSLTASAIYILNDYNDIEEDRQHARKKYRPLAAGTITPTEAIQGMILLLTLGSTLMGLINLNALIILLSYVILNVAYTFYLKHIAIIDVTVIALGFVLRLFVGAAVTGVMLSPWIIIMTFLLALFLALAKRRDDILIYLETGKTMRKVIHGYNLKFLDLTIGVVATIVIVAYIMYITSVRPTVGENTEYLYLTVLFVILGILKYLQISLVLQESGSPTKIILRSRFIQLIIFLWILTFGLVLY